MRSVPNENQRWTIYETDVSTRVESLLVPLANNERTGRRVTAA